MTDRERVWLYVVYEDMGYDGYSVPVAVFSDYEEAKHYCKTSSYDLDWEELELNQMVPRNYRLDEEESQEWDNEGGQ